MVKTKLKSPIEDPLEAVQREYSKLLKLHPTYKELTENILEDVSSDTRQEIYDNPLDYTRNLLMNNKELIDEINNYSSDFEFSEEEISQIIDLVHYQVSLNMRGLKESLDDSIIDGDATKEAILVAKVLDLAGRTFTYVNTERVDKELESLSEVLILNLRLIAVAEGKIPIEEVIKDAVYVSEDIYPRLKDSNTFKKLYSGDSHTLTLDEAESKIRVERSIDLYTSREITISRAAEIANLSTYNLREIYQDLDVPMQSLSLNKDLIEEGRDVFT